VSTLFGAMLALLGPWDFVIIVAVVACVVGTKPFVRALRTLKSGGRFSFLLVSVRPANRPCELADLSSQPAAKACDAPSLRVLQKEGRARMRLSAVFAVVIGAAICVSVASASKPTRVHSPFTDDSFSGVCSFTVSRHILADNTYLTTFSDGTQMYTGTFKERLTNETTGKYIDFNGSGPIVIEYNADGSITETDYGPQFERPPGQLLLTTGPVVWQYDSSFNFISYTQIGGTSQDVCVLLA
jgi:hypothetical protein